MRKLFIAFFVGICCFLFACDVRTRSDQEPIIINFYEEVYYIEDKVYVDNIEKDKKTVTSQTGPCRSI